MRKIAFSTLVLFFCVLQAVWADHHETFSVKGPVHAQHLSFQEIEEGKLLVSVTDKEEKPIMGLVPKDFSILKGDKTAKIIDVEPLVTSKDIGLNIVLVVDNSFSMNERDAVEPLLTALEELYKMIRPIDQIAVVVYDNDKTIQIDDQKLHAKVLRSENVDTLRKMVRNQMTKGLSAGTYLYDAMMLGLDLARQWPEKSNKFMVVLTDGEDLNSAVDEAALRKVAKTVPNLGAFAVDYMPRNALDDFLTAFAGENNGQIRKARSAEELIPIFKSFSSTLLHRYVVSYRFLSAPVGTLLFEPAQVTIEEISTIDSAPLLNYIFFQNGQSELSDKYIQLQNQAETESFSESGLASVMDKYRNLLNIIGHRMRQYPEASITLVGCNANIGEEYGRKDLSKSRVEAVRAYLRYVWGIPVERMMLEVRNLPEAPSTNRIVEGQAENQRVEIRSDHPGMLDTVKSEYVGKRSGVQQISVIPKISAEAGIRDWKLTLKCGETIIGAFKGTGDLSPSYTLPLEDRHLEKMVKAGRITASLRVTDKENESLVLDDAAVLPVQFIQRKEQLAQKQGYTVREKYALILFDYDSANIKSRNRIIVDRIIGRMQEVPDAKVDIVGHTDNIGKEEYNIKLSERRAKSVKEQFASTHSDHMTMSGDGPRNPLYDNNIPEGRALNRTVTIDLEYEKK
jgi:outer membrane protein OmpA-like peptidoglycan-associated protein/Mg-chelatase subunit ChlD